LSHCQEVIFIGDYTVSIPVKIFISNDFRTYLILLNFPKAQSTAKEESDRCFLTNHRGAKDAEEEKSDRPNLISVRYSYNMVVKMGAKIIMLSGIKQKTIVGKDGKIELSTTELPEGTVVEVIVLVETPTKEDETTYLLKSETNKKHLLTALENVDKGNLIYVDLDEYEKSSI
jgi:antitoxin YefM